MSVTGKFIVFQAAIFLPFFIGIFLRTGFSNPEDFTKRLIRINLICLEPIIVFWCVWGLLLARVLVLLPFAGFFLIACGVFAGSFFATRLGLSGKKRQTFLISSSLANHGFTMGGFLCFAFLGEQGLGLSVILVLYFIPYVFCFVFPYAKSASAAAVSGESSIKTFLTDARNMPLFAMISGLAVQLCGFRRPDIFFPVDLLLIASVSLYYLTLGINFSGFEVKGFIKEHMGLAGIKFIFIPAVTFFALKLFPLDSSAKAVVMLQAFMPTAVYSVVTSVLFDLDTRLASSLFVVNTLLFLAVVLPAVFLLKGILLGIQ